MEDILSVSRENGPQTVEALRKEAVKGSLESDSDVSVFVVSEFARYRDGLAVDAPAWR